MRWLKRQLMALMPDMSGIEFDANDALSNSIFGGII